MCEHYRGQSSFKVSLLLFTSSDLKLGQIIANNQFFRSMITKSLPIGKPH